MQGDRMAVRLEKQDSIGHIVLDRPPANTYDKAFMEELDATIEEARRDDAVKAIVLRSGNERFFSAGADVSVFAKSDFDGKNAFVVCANEAIAAGIVDEVVPADELLDRAVERARVYATGPTFAIGRIKLATVQGFGMRLGEGLKLERQLLIELFKSADAKEGVTAFVEKRKPNYTGT